MSAVQLKRWSRRDYDHMIRAAILGPEDRVELVEGEIVEMSPRDPPHSSSVLLVSESLRPILPTGYHLRIQVPLAASDESEPEPDVSIVRGEIRDYLVEHPTAAVLVVEVVHSSVLFDRRRKSRVYARAGIPEYWIVNTRARVVEVYRDPRPDGKYAYVQRCVESATIHPLFQPGAVIRVSALLP